MNDTVITAIYWNKNPRIRSKARSLNLTTAQVDLKARTEANGLAVWANWVPGVLTPLDALGLLPKGSSNLRVDIDAAIAASFIPTV